LRNIRKYVKDHHGQKAVDDMERYAEKRIWGESVVEGNLNEIGYADDLDDSNFSTDRLLKLGKVVGQIEGNDVMMASGGSEKVYFLVVDNQVSAFLGFRNNQLKNIKNFTNAEGVVRALIGFLVHKKGQKLIISQDEPMTPAGLKWISRLIKSPRGLTITDQNNEPVDVETLEREISSAKNSGTHGPTSITISENKVFGKKLRENEKLRESQSLLMPVNFYKTPKQSVSEGKEDKINASKPRNFVAKNATTSGAGAHKDKKKAAKQGDVKHKNKDIHMAEAEKNPHTSALGKALYRDLSKEKKASPAQVQRNKERWAKREQGVAEGVAETLPMDDAVKVLSRHGAVNFKTTSNELSFYKQGRPFGVDLVMNPDATRSVTLSSLNSATRGLKGQGVAEEQLDELSCWSGYTRVQGVPAGAPGSCKKKTNEEDVAEATGDVKFDKISS
jgi:hypothetical protein